MSAHSIIKTLGYAGLIPFVIPAILVTFDIYDSRFDYFNACHSPCSLK